MGLIIQRIEPNGRVYKDGRLKTGDRIFEINETSLIGVDYQTAQLILREAISKLIEDDERQLELRIARNLSLDANTQSVYNFEQGDDKITQFIDDTSSQEYINERPIEIEFEGNHNEDEQAYYKQNSESSLNDNQTTENLASSQYSSNNNPSSINMNALNTKKLGKKITVQLVKGPQGLGFKLAARDNCTTGEFSPIYIKNILPKGAAIADGRLQRGDRLLEVNKMDMTQKTLHEAVNILRNTKLGSCVELVVSRQIMPNLNGNTSSLSNSMNNTSSQHSNGMHLNISRELNGIAAAQLPRELDEHEYTNDEAVLSEPEPKLAVEEENSEMSNQNSDQANTKTNRRHLLTFEIALNDTGSAGLGVSVKGKTKRIEDNDCSIDLGIFVKTVINGGAASKDGRLRPNDQLININGFSLLGKSNEEAMLILREAMQVESKPGHIQLTVSRKLKPNQLQKENVQATVGAKNEEKTAVAATPVKKVSYLCDIKNEENFEIDNSDDPSRRSISASPEKKLQDRQVVRVINHAANPQKQMLDEELDAGNKFNRDAPNRRSMSEKRTKIGAVPNSMSNYTHINRQRNQSLVDRVDFNPKRSQTINILPYTVNNKVGNYSSNTLNSRSHKSSYPGQNGAEIKQQQQHEEQTQRDKENFARIGSFESVISRNAIQSECFLIFLILYTGGNFFL